MKHILHSTLCMLRDVSFQRELLLLLVLAAPRAPTSGVARVLMSLHGGCRCRVEARVLVLLASSAGVLSCCTTAAGDTCCFARRVKPGSCVCMNMTVDSCAFTALVSWLRNKLAPKGAATAGSTL